jgi:predicted HicB family RNase H-like nuclease
MAFIENWFSRQHTDKPLPRNSGLLTIRLPPEARNHLEIEAAKRGISIGELCGRLLGIAAVDGLVGAVLDDTVA